MKNIFLAFIFIVCSVVAVNVFAQAPPAPTCNGSVVKIYCTANPNHTASCPVDSHPVFQSGCSYVAAQGSLYNCRKGCSCPDGWSYHSGIDIQGNATSGCVEEDTGGDPGDDCEYGADANGVCYPEDCPFGDGTPEACSNNASSSSSSQPICVPPFYNDPITGQCVTEPDSSSSSSSASSESGGGSSSGTGSSAGEDSGNSSSSGSGDGEGDGNGDGDGDSGSSAGGGTGGGGGGSGSSAGAGECDPTAKSYLECLNSKEIEIPSEGGSFDGVGTNSEDRIGELEGELTDVINQIKSEINDTIGVSLSGGGSMSDDCKQISGVSVCFGWSRWSAYLNIIAQAIMAAAYIAAFIIIMRQ